MTTPNFFVLDPFETLCGDVDGFCLADRDRFQVYWDVSHLTIKGVLLTTDLHFRALGQASAYLERQSTK